ncbi:MAG: hypothetical protein ABW151_01225, partial [Pseudorhodoplanes sp.]
VRSSAYEAESEDEAEDAHGCLRPGAALSAAVLGGVITMPGFSPLAPHRKTASWVRPFVSC